MKNKLFQWIVSCLVLIVLVGLIIYEQSKDKSEAVGGAYNVDRLIINGNALGALTSMTLLLPNATTTFTIGIDGSRGVDLNMAFYSTSTPVSLIWFSEYSYDNISFYREDAQSTSNAITTHQGGTASSSPTYHTWTPTTATSTVFKNVHLAQSGYPFGAKYMRLNLACWVQVATANQHCKWWGEAIKLPY